MHIIHDLEWFSFECRKTKTKVITLANHIGHRQYIEPIKTRSNYMWLTQSAGKSCERVTIGFGFTSDWMKRWRESFKPIASCRKCKTNYFSTLKWKPLYYTIHSVGNDDQHQTLQKTLARLLAELRIPAEVRVRKAVVWLFDWLTFVSFLWVVKTRALLR